MCVKINLIFHDIDKKKLKRSQLNLSIYKQAFTYYFYIYMSIVI